MGADHRRSRLGRLAFHGFFGSANAHPDGALVAGIEQVEVPAPIER